MPDMDRISVELHQNNRSRAQVIRLEPELQKVEREIANYRRFGELCSELVAVNEQLCRLRPVTEIKNERELGRLKNLAAEVQQEVAQEIEQLVRRLLGAAGDSDLEASEWAVPECTE